MKNKKTQARLQLIKHMVKRSIHQADISRITGIPQPTIQWYRETYDIQYPEVKLTPLMLNLIEEAK